MSFYNAIYENIIFPLSDRVTEWDAYKSLSFLNKSQWWTSEELNNFQIDRLRSLIDHSYNNVPYYKELFDKNDINPKNIKGIDDLKKIPLLTKELVAENFTNGKLIAKNINKNQLILNQSSGSTGHKTIYYIDKFAYGFNIACNLRGWSWMGYRGGDKIIKISQNKRNTFLKRFQDIVNRTKLFHNDYDEKNLVAFYDLLLSYQPQFIRSYPDPLFFISSFIKKKNLNLTSLRGINTTGNILFSEVRHKIESLFSCKIFDSYSCEGGANFFECQSHECYHISMEYAITEIIDKNGSEVDKGEQGTHITTDLWNYATPFIRYNSKDIVEKTNCPCTCGRNLISIKRIIGRDNDIIVTPNGRFLIAQTFTTYFKYIQTILSFQVYQKAIDHIEFRLKVTKDYSEEIQSKIYDYWDNYFEHNVKIEILILKEINPLPSGKNRFIIRDKSIKLNL